MSKKQRNYNCKTGCDTLYYLDDDLQAEISEIPNYGSIFANSKISYWFLILDIT